MQTADYTKGMVLVTGSAGSGKSTTMACLIDRINHSREGHIITLEDPLEYLHRHDRCIVSQREICTDTENYLTSLRATLRQSPDVILLGEIVQLSMVLQAVISQQLIPDVNGKVIPVFEVMRLTPAIRNMIRDNKLHQIEGVIASSSQDQMRSMDHSLAELYKQGRIHKDTAIKYALNPDMIRHKLV